MEGSQSQQKNLENHIGGRWYETKTEAAAYLRISRRTFDKLLPQIPHFRIGRKLLFRKSELDEWLEQYRQQPRDLDLQQIANAAIKNCTEQPNLRGKGKDENT